jgi:tRNA threonylcarbamoyladenosine biosynthesis protein TsaB
MYILCIDTGTDKCSIALCNESQVLAQRNSDRDFSHASIITIYIKQCLTEIGIGMKDIAAVALSSGPGSYTGLRVGASTAKGICFAMDIPLIAIDSLTSLAYGVGQDHKGNIIALIDARRMDAYAAEYDNNHTLVTPMEKITIDDAYVNSLQNRGIIAVGDGVVKCATLLTDAHIALGHMASSAEYLRIPAFQKYTANQFENLDYFSPMYLNQPNITVNKKKLI